MGRGSPPTRAYTIAMLDSKRGEPSPKMRLETGDLVANAAAAKVLGEITLTRLMSVVVGGTYLAVLANPPRSVRSGSAHLPGCTCRIRASWATACRSWTSSGRRSCTPASTARQGPPMPR